MKGLKKGFTLLELIVVISVIGVLGTFGYSKFTEVMLETKSSQLGQQLKKIEIGLTKY
jgi:prepilin-type N-terminal cleavage/methylation domain-containing protein